MGTSVERHSAQTDLSKKAEGYGVPGERIDGMDVIAVREAVAEGIRLAREERRPTLLEAFTYRYRGHSAADPEVYREREEVEEWQQQRPDRGLRAALRRGRACSASARCRRCARRPSEEVLAAVEFADASPEPALDTLYENLYVLDSDAGWYAVDERSPEPHRGEREGDDARRGARAGRGGRRLRRAARRAAARTRPSTATPRRASSRRSPSEGEDRRRSPRSRRAEEAED